MTKKNWLSRAFVLILCLAICLSTVACFRKNDGGQSAEPAGTPGTGSMTYTIQVCAETGTPLEKIGVYIYTDTTMSELVWFAKTDGEGKLTFSDIASDNFVAVLADVPAGYLVEEYYPMTGELTKIKLSAGLMEGDLSKLTYKLGDLMLDFSVTAPDGTVYKFSELLEEKEAVILNFWYLQCEPCKKEFPYLQEAYEKYRDKVAVLALNPVNQDNEQIEQFRKDNGYTFPMMACDPNWQKAMQIGAYPTTVVIDRFGYITFTHRESITEAGSFEAMMDYFSAENYTHTVFKNMGDLEEAAGVTQTVGTAENPIQIGASYSFQVTVKPGQEMHYEIYRMITLHYLSLVNPNAYVIHNGVTYTGSIYLPVIAEDTNSLVKLVFGNNGTETQTYTVVLDTPRGSPNNPYTLKLDADNQCEFDIGVPAGNDMGVFHRYSTEEEGTFTVELLDSTPGVEFDVTVETIKPPEIPIQRKLSTDGVVNGETGNQTITVNAYKDSRITVSAGSTGTDHPAVTVKLQVRFQPGAIEDTTEKEITYSVNVTDENRKPVPGIMLDLTVDGKNTTISTDEKGVAFVKLPPGTYTLTMRKPNGYVARNLTYKLTEKNPSASIKLETLVTQTYTVRVVDGEGKPVPEAFVTIDTVSLQTDENGVAVFHLVEGNYTATVAKMGYFTLNNIGIPGDTREAQATLTLDPEASFMQYSVNLVDYYGNAVSGATVIFYRDGAAIANAVTDAGGVAAKKLQPGEYTVGVSGNYYIFSGNTTVTEANPEASLVIVSGVTGESEILYVDSSQYNSYFVDTGMTYVKLDSGINYFQFMPGDASGLYRITTTDPSAVVSYWGSPFYMHHVTEDSNNIIFDTANNLITVNHKPSGAGGVYVLGIQGGTETVLMITRAGDYIKDDNDLPIVEYTPVKAPVTQNIKIPAGKKLTYVNVLTGKEADYQLVLDGSGNYRLNSADGPQVYVHLGATNKRYKVPYLCLSDFIGVTDSYAANPFYQYVTDGNGVRIHKENYAPLLISYCQSVKDSDVGLYPLTGELIHMIQNGGENKGWYDSSSPNCIFKNENWEAVSFNKDIAWMFALCYFS